MKILILTRLRTTGLWVNFWKPAFSLKLSCISDLGASRYSEKFDLQLFYNKKRGTEDFETDA